MAESKKPDDVKKTDLEVIESYLPKDLVQNFKKNEKAQGWIEDLKLDGLFKFWLKVQGNTEVKITGMTNKNICI